MNGRAALGLAGLALLGACTARLPAPVDERRPVATPAKTPVAKPALAAMERPQAPGHYVVRQGDTLYSIALEHGLDFRDLARWNGIEDPTKLRVGQSLRVRPPEAAAAVQVGAVRAEAPIEARALSAPAPEGATRTAPRALRLPYSEQNLAALQRGAEAPAKAAAARAEVPKREAPRAAADAIEFIWPAKGAVIAGFAEPRVKGIDIGGRLGDPVWAAAPGKVIYVGAGIQGLGKFVVIKHNEEYSTVYAHTREVHVKMDQTVARGQRIAEMGDTDADRPKLHFQIRRLGKPLDPLMLLPPPAPG